MSNVASTGTVEWVHVAAMKGAPAMPVALAEVVVNHGIVGDWRVRPGSRRQVTLVDADVLEDVGRTLGIEVAPGASRRQVTVRGMDLNAAIGHHVAVGEVVIDVTLACDPCEQMEVAIGPGGRAALEGRGGICGRVVSGGTIRPGDLVRIVSASET
jgi:MOSC domain-containing protein YiiM